MKGNKGLWVGLALGILGAALVRSNRKSRSEVAAWQAQQRLTPDVLTCPTCHSALHPVTLPSGEGYHCTTCRKTYPVAGGITHFIAPEELTNSNQRFALMYDWFSWGYRAFSAVAFAYIGMSEEQARREITDRLEPGGGLVLEVSIGPGVNLPYLMKRQDVGELFGLDISLGQLYRCRSYVAKHGWPIHLHLANAEQLPYKDQTFGGVFHIGGINFFNDKQKAIEEMIRVARPGTRIVICDENEKGARAYERFLPSFKRTLGKERAPIVPPVDLVPPEMQEIRVFEVWNGWMYCIEFRKP